LNAVAIAVAVAVVVVAAAVAVVAAVAADAANLLIQAMNPVGNCAIRAPRR